MLRTKEGIIAPGVSTIQQRFWRVSLPSAQHSAGSKTPSPAEEHWGSVHAVPVGLCLPESAVGTVSSHHCVGAGESPRASAKGPPHTGREWAIQGWSYPQLCWPSQKPSTMLLLMRKFPLTKLWKSLTVCLQVLDFIWLVLIWALYYFSP